MIQLEGPITIDGDDVADYITRCTLKWKRNTTVRPATFGDATETQRAGAAVYECEMEFLNDTAAASVWATLLTAINTDSAEVPVVAKLTSGVIGPDNPEFTFTIVVTGTEAGGTVGEQNRHSYTFPVTGAPTVDTAP